MTKLGKTLIFVFVLLLLVFGFFWFGRDSKPATPEENIENLVIENEILGNKYDLLAFSILPGAKVSGENVSIEGEIKGGYFFEGNILVNILDKNKNLLKAGYATATSEWMTSDPVSFSTVLDFTDLPKGEAYIEIKNDNASGLPENDKSVMVPIVIE